MNLPSLPRLPHVHVGTVSAVVRDTAYVTLGLGVLGAQRGAETVRATKCRIDQLAVTATTAGTHIVGQFTSRVTGLLHSAR